MKKNIWFTLGAAAIAIVLVGCSGEDTAKGSEFVGQGDDTPSDYIPPEVAAMESAPSVPAAEAYGIQEMPETPADLDTTDVAQAMPGFEDENGNPMTMEGAMAKAVEEYEMLAQVAEVDNIVMPPLTNVAQLVQFRIIAAVPKVAGKTWVVENGKASLK